MSSFLSIYLICCSRFDVRAGIDKEISMGFPYNTDAIDLLTQTEVYGKVITKMAKSNPDIYSTIRYPEDFYARYGIDRIDKKL